MINELNLSNLGVLMSTIPNALHQKIKNECLDFMNKENFASGLTSKNVAQHYYLDTSVNELFEFLSPMVLHYAKRYNYFNNLDFLSKGVPLGFSKPWFNFQKKTEFLPAHTHSGILSYTIWIQLPELEKTEEKRFDGCFEFHYSNIVGSIKRHCIFLDKSYEAKIILFPWNLPHCVYPFYDSDEIRISVSGNVIFNNS